MSKKIIADFAAYVKRTNKKFLAATKAEQRVIIAKDAIARLYAHNITVQKGTLVLMDQDVYNTIESFKEFVNTESCEVCAKGALFCSLIGRINKVSVDEVDKLQGNLASNIVHLKLLKYFSLTQLDLIETAFEGISHLGKIDRVEEKKAIVFRESYKEYYDEDEFDLDEDKLLIGICENIIANKGTFKP